MLGVTIAIGNSYKRMAERAAASFAKNGGLETRILTPRLPAHRLSKLHLFDLVADDKFIFFDADALMVGQEDLGFGFIKDGFAAVQPYAPGELPGGWPPLWYETRRQRVARKCNQHGLNSALYFNSGVMWLDRQQHLEIFEGALAMPITGPGDDDELHLNIAAQALRVNIELIDDRYNRIITGEEDVPENTVIVHGVRCFDPMQGRGSFMELEF